MKQINKLLILFSIIISIALLPLQGYALGKDTKEINHLSDADRSKIEEFINKQMEDGMIPGISVVIVKDGETVYQKGFGYSDIKSQKPVISETLFEIGSNSKAFTALGILNLQKDGFIKLEDEVTKYIPWLVVKYNGKEVPITIEQLLHHTSGIPFKTIDRIPVSNQDNALEETAKTLINIELDSKPGVEFQYATINYDVLGLIIEKVTGISYEKYIEESIIGQMGLDNTYLFHNKAVDENLAKGYKLGFLKPQLYNAPVYRGNKPAGYIISSAEDMAKWLKIQMGTDETSKLSKELVEASHQPNKTVAPCSYDSFYAAGWRIYEGKEKEIYHGGNNPNYSSFILIKPDNGIGIAVLSNINSQYIPPITYGINEILKQNRLENMVLKDMNIAVDKASVVIAAIMGLLTLVVLYFTIMILKQILIGKREFAGIGIKNTLKACISFIFILGISCCIYKVPYVVYRGVSWGFVFVWLPVSIKIALYLIYISIWLLFIHSLLKGFYKKKNVNCNTTVENLSL